MQGSQQAEDNLIVTVRFLSGSYHGSGDWPPAPGRIFQALVAGVARGQHIKPEYQAVFKWLEALSAPRIAAPKVRVARPLTKFVPNNDLDAVGGDPGAVSKIRARKVTELRLFDMRVPLLYVWELAGPGPDVDKVAEVVHQLYRLGRGEDPAYAAAEILSSAETQELLASHPGALHVPHPQKRGMVFCPTRGTFASLQQRYEGFLSRFHWEKEGKKWQQHFRQPPKTRFGYVDYDSAPLRFHFDLRAGQRFSPVALARAGLFVDRLRKAAARLLMDAYSGASKEVAHIDRLLIGRDAGAADKALRVRIIPIPSVGHPEVVPAIRRFMVEIPLDCPLIADDLVWAFTKLEPGDMGGLLVPNATILVSEESSMAQRFCHAARTWRSVTPVVLPSARRRRIPPGGEAPKGGSEARKELDTAVSAVRVAVEHAEIRARPSSIRVQREPFGRREQTAEAFAEGTRFAKHSLWHVEITWAESQQGPILLGDGRFMGLGLMRPIDAGGWGAWQLCVTTGSIVAGSAEAVSRALRRMVLARVQQQYQNTSPPDFFHGHTNDGKPIRNGGRRHLAFHVDPIGQRLLIIAPHLVDHRQTESSEDGYLRRLERALAGVRELRAGRAGVFLLQASPLDEDDPILSPSTIWQSLTPYTATRSPRDQSFAQMLPADVAMECQRRNLPVPDVKMLRTAPGLRAEVRLHFPRPVRGPIALGRTGQLGGGLFAPLE